MLAIYPDLLSPKGSIVLPSGLSGQLFLWRRYTRTFNFRNAQPEMSPSGWWALTPPSHPYLVRQGGCFLLHDLTLADYFPLRSGMPCVARTFLSRMKTAAASRSAAFLCKSTIFFLADKMQVKECKNVSSGF